MSKGYEMVTVAIDRDKGSQYALRWAVENLLGKGKSVTLLHIKQRQPSIPTPCISCSFMSWRNSGQTTETISASGVGNQASLLTSDVADDVTKTYRNQNDNKELFLPFRCFCTRKNIKVNEVVFEETDIAKAICDYVQVHLIENLILSAPTRNAFVRNFKGPDIPTSVLKLAPEFCTVYIVSKGKMQTTRSATIPLPNSAGPPRQNQSFPPQSIMGSIGRAPGTPDRTPFVPPARSNMSEDPDIKSPFTRYKATNRSYGDIGMSDTDISFVSARPSGGDRMFPSYDDMGVAPPRLSNSSDTENSRISFGSPFSGLKSGESFGLPGGGGFDNPNMSWSSSNNQEDVEAEMRRLKQELKQTMDMYSTACKEALSAKQKAMELHKWKMEEQRRLEEARHAEEAALAIAEREKAKCKAAIEAAEAAQRIAELEAKKRITAEKKALKEAEEKKKVLDVLANNDVRYRKYSIEEIEAATEFFAISRKIGEGGYGPVYKCYLDHTPVAIKVLRPDAAQGRSQFQQEVEVLSCIRHPNMVLLLGACPEYGCLVYEYMANGSLEDRLFRRGNSPILSWQLRFRIAAEIGTGLLFLHQTKPEPLVHRDLKPGNILLDRNYVSKISDVGLARLVPPSVADTVTQYRMTSTAGTFCYIDPEYQQTGMLGIKSDIYSLGVMLLQIITSKPPMGLTHHVERAIEKGTFAEMLDPAVTDWPVEEAIVFAKLALKCAELRRKDRPDLGSVVLPQLNKLRELAEESMPNLPMGSAGPSSHISSSTSVISSESQVRVTDFDSPFNRVSQQYADRRSAMTNS